jgi:DNA-binding NarL/FixJ family response regulator
LEENMLSAELHFQGPIHVLVGDNSRIHCDLLAQALKRDHRLHIIGSASSSQEFLEIAAHQVPDTIIISANLSANLDDDPMGGMATLRAFHEAHPQIPAVVLLDCPKREVVLDAFRAGARGIFSKNASLEMLCKCVRVVHEGQIWASSSEVKFALEALSSAPTIRAINAGGLNLLSPRELEVVHYVAEGLTNREIGERLGLSRHTIKNHLFKIFDKLGASNRTELLFLTLSKPPSSGTATREQGSLFSGKGRTSIVGGTGLLQRRASGAMRPVSALGNAATAPKCLL